MSNFWLGAIFGWVVGELGLCMVLALISSREDRVAQAAHLRRVADRLDDENDDA